MEVNGVFTNQRLRPSCRTKPPTEALRPLPAGRYPAQHQKLSVQPSVPGEKRRRSNAAGEIPSNGDRFNVKSRFRMKIPGGDGVLITTSSMWRVPGPDTWRRKAIRTRAIQASRPAPATDAVGSTLCRSHQPKFISALRFLTEGYREDDQRDTGSEVVSGHIK